MLWFLCPIFALWWLITPSFYPRAISSRSQILIEMIITWIGLLVICVLLSPTDFWTTNNQNPVNSNHQEIGFGFIGALIVAIGALILSIRAKKHHTEQLTQSQNTQLQTTLVQTEHALAITNQQLQDALAKIKQLEQAKNPNKINQENYNTISQLQEQLSSSQKKQATLQNDIDQLLIKQNKISEQLKRTQKELSEKDSLVNYLESTLKNTQEELSTAKAALAFLQLETEKSSNKDTKSPISSRKQKPIPNHNLKLSDDKTCTIVYEKSAQDITTRNLIVRNIKQNTAGNWLVSAVDIEQARVKTFRIDRIKELTYNDQYFCNTDNITETLRTLELYQ